MNRSLIALSKYSLTPEDQRIFEQWTDSHTQTRYKTADVHALISSAAALRAFGSIRECVRTMESAKRSMERAS